MTGKVFDIGARPFTRPKWHVGVLNWLKNCSLNNININTHLSSYEAGTAGAVQSSCAGLCIRLLRGSKPVRNESSIGLRVSS